MVNRRGGIPVGNARRPDRAIAIRTRMTRRFQLSIGRDGVHRGRGVPASASRRRARARGVRGRICGSNFADRESLLGCGVEAVGRAPTAAQAIFLQSSLLLHRRRATVVPRVIGVPSHRAERRPRQESHDEGWEGPQSSVIVWTPMAGQIVLLKVAGPFGVSVRSGRLSE